MSISMINKSMNAIKIWFDDLKMFILLADGREMAVPLDWFPKLRNATEKQRQNWCLIGCSEGILFEDLDEDILVEALL